MAAVQAQQAHGVLARMPARRQDTQICSHQQTTAKRHPATQNGGSVRVSPGEGLLRSVTMSGTGSAGGVPARQRGAQEPGSETAHWRSRAGSAARQA
jgi:hypothetical protein